MAESTEATVKVKAFANLRTLVPAESDLPVDASATVASLMERLSLPREKVAIVFLDGRHADLSDPVKPGQTLSFFPPVGGG